MFLNEEIWTRKKSTNRLRSSIEQASDVYWISKKQKNKQKCRKKGDHQLKFVLVYCEQQLSWLSKKAHAYEHTIAKVIAIARDNSSAIFYLLLWSVNATYISLLCLFGRIYWRIITIESGIIFCSFHCVIVAVAVDEIFFFLLHFDSHAFIQSQSKKLTKQKEDKKQNTICTIDTNECYNKNRLCWQNRCMCVYWKSVCIYKRERERERIHTHTHTPSSPLCVLCKNQHKTSNACIVDDCDVVYYEWRLIVGNQGAPDQAKNNKKETPYTQCMCVHGCCCCFVFVVKCEMTATKV